MLKNIINKLQARLYRHLPSDEAIIKKRYQVIFGKELDLAAPQTFNEKINWIMCNYRNPLYELCSDKVDVRKYISSKGLDKYLTELFGVYDSVDDIDFDTLPDKFVIKATHSYGGVSVVEDKVTADLKLIKSKLLSSFSKNLYDSTREWQYKNLQPRIMAEEYIEPNKDESLLDYKFYCFNGVPRFIHVSADIIKGGSYEMDFYDTDWNHLDAQRVGRLIGKGMEKPAELEEMLDIARVLSADFPHVRVDLYNVRGKIFIGELTFTTASGTGRFVDEKWDYEFGKYFKLPKSGLEIIDERIQEVKKKESV